MWIHESETIWRTSRLWSAPKFKSIFLEVESLLKFTASVSSFGHEMLSDLNSVWIIQFNSTVSVTFAQRFEPLKLWLISLINQIPDFFCRRQSRFLFVENFCIWIRPELKRSQANAAAGNLQRTAANGKDKWKRVEFCIDNRRLLFCFLELNFVLRKRVPRLDDGLQCSLSVLIHRATFRRDQRSLAFEWFVAAEYLKSIWKVSEKYLKWIGSIH